ncbi:MAG: thymidine phosphorylase, partial [Pseudomonadota bacterium]
VAALGGPSDFIENWTEHLPAAPVIRDVTAERDGFVAAIDGRALGEAVVALGGGRRRSADAIDPRVGFDRIEGLGASIARGEPIARVHAASDEDADRAAAALRAAYAIEDRVPLIGDLIVGRIGGGPA